MNKTIIKQIVSCVDLTRLQFNDNIENINLLCDKAITKHGTVAGICILPEWISHVRKMNIDTKIISVINFPKGDKSQKEIQDEIKFCLDEGAQELDIVVPYHDCINNSWQSTYDLFESSKELCSPNIILKAILEVGAIQDEELIRKACVLAVSSKIDFIKTSTGVVYPGATINIVKTILKQLKRVSLKNSTTGVKVSGGVSDVNTALNYIHLANDYLPNISKDVFRIGSSKLLDDIKNLV